MLESPFRNGKHAFGANWKARNQGWWNTDLLAIPISGCGNLSWIHLQVENPSLAEQPGRPTHQSPKCAAESLALWGWSWGCLSKMCAAVKVTTMMGLWPASALSFGNDLETCQLRAAVLVLALLPLLHRQRVTGRELKSSGSAIPRIWQVPAMAASSPTTYQPLGIGTVQVYECGWLPVPPLAQVSVPRKWVALWQSAWRAVRLHVGLTCLASLQRDAQWQLILVDRGAKAKGASLSRRYEGEISLGNEGHQKCPEQEEEIFFLQPPSGKCILKTPPPTSCLYPVLPF